MLLYYLPKKKICKNENINIHINMFCHMLSHEIDKCRFAKLVA